MALCSRRVRGKLKRMEENAKEAGGVANPPAPSLWMNATSPLAYLPLPLSFLLGGGFVPPLPFGPVFPLSGMLNPL